LVWIRPTILKWVINLLLKFMYHFSRHQDSLLSFLAASMQMDLIASASDYTYAGTVFADTIPEIKWTTQNFIKLRFTLRAIKSMLTVTGNLLKLNQNHVDSSGVFII